MSRRFYKHPYRGRYKFIRNWFDDREGQVFEQKIDNWLSLFDEEEKKFLLECLKRYSFIRASEYKYAITTLYYRFNNKNPTWKENSKIFAIPKKNAQVSNSDEFFFNFWKINNIKNECKYDIREFSDCLDLFDKFILIDDFVGSGNTVIKYLEEVYEEFPALKRKPLHILCLYTTNSGELALKNYATSKRVNLSLYWYKKGDKFFKDGHYYSGQDLVDKINLYNRIWEEKYNNPKDPHKYGYANTQALFSLNENTPNNTLGIFWKNTDNYNPLFERYSEPHPKLDQMIRERKNKDSVKKEHLWKDPIDSYDNLLFIGYCARKKIVFNFSDACQRFHLTPEQLIAKINYIIDKNYVKVENGRFVETQLFWKSISNKSKVKAFFNAFINEVIELKSLDINETNYMPKDFEKIFGGYSKNQ